MKWPLCLTLCLALFPRPGSATTIDFEALPDSVALIDQLAAQGVTFQNALTLTAGFSLNEADFPPHSGVRVVGDDGIGPMQILFAAPANHISAWFTFSSGLTVSAFDSLGVLQGSYSPVGTSNMGSSTEIALNFNHISRLAIAGASPASLVMDDLTFELASAVPEPGTLSLLGMGLFGLCYRRAKSALFAPSAKPTLT